ncbi:MAG: WecB/TagA/CpsF family glycosyltransferase [Clostridia bacterium]
MKNRVLSIFIDDITLNEAIDKIITLSKISSINAPYIVTPNAEIANLAERDSNFAAIINTADIVLADGAGVILAAKLCKKPIKNGKVSGVDVARAILPIMEKNNVSLYLLGGKPDVAKTAADNISRHYPRLKIAGYSDGYFETDAKACEKIIESRADIVFVCLGSPKQEYFMYNNKEKLSNSVLLGLGGTIDVIAGTAKLAPEFFRKAGLEWLYRLFHQPSRFFRMLSIPAYLFKAIIHKSKD